MVLYVCIALNSKQWGSHAGVPVTIQAPVEIPPFWEHLIRPTPMQWSMQKLSKQDTGSKMFHESRGACRRWQGPVAKACNPNPQPGDMFGGALREGDAARRLRDPHELGVLFGFSEYNYVFCGKDMSVCAAVARNINHGSHASNAISWVTTQTRSELRSEVGR